MELEIGRIGNSLQKLYLKKNKSKFSFLRFFDVCFKRHFIWLNLTWPLKMMYEIPTPGKFTLKIFL